jgi:hypothetical protein
MDILVNYNLFFDDSESHANLAKIVMLLQKRRTAKWMITAGE